MKLTPEANVVELFKGVVYELLQEAREFVLDKPFQPTLMFVGKARVEYLKLPGTNTQAYYIRKLRPEESFITLTPEPNVLNLFSSVIYEFS
jgi:hypothetical protein